MKTNKNNTISKVLKLTHRLKPGHISLIIFSKIINVTGKYVPIVFGSIILDALVQHKPFEEILRYALIMISIAAFTSLVYWGLNHLITVNGSVIGEKVDQMFCEKSFVIDYDILEKRETLDKIKKAQDGMNARGDFSAFSAYFASFIEHALSIIYSIILLVPLFIPKASVMSGFLPGLLNKGYSFLILIFMLALSIVISAIVKQKEAKLQHELFERNVQTNREYGYFYSLIFDYANGKYVRLYKSQPLIEKKMNKIVQYLEDSFKYMFTTANKNQLPFFFVNCLLQIVSYLYVGLKAIYGMISIGSALKYISAYANLVESVSGVFSKQAVPGNNSNRKARRQ